MAQEFVGRWSGEVAEGAEAAHDQFVAQLRTPASADLLRRASITEYAIYQDGRALDIVFKSEKPSIIAGFLRNKRLWPSFWEFSQPGAVDMPQNKPLVFHWTRD